MYDGVPNIPAPWDLRGRGYILIYRFRRNFVDRCGNVPDFLKGRYAGGLGSVMLVNYEASNAGPYGELLFIPGKFRYAGQRLDTISRIYVSTMASVVNGRRNWGIPKEQADFSFEKAVNGTERAAIRIGDRVVARFTLKSGGLSFPVSTKLLPFPLVQRHEGRDYHTNFFGRGRGRLAKLTDIEIDPELFPDIAQCRPIAVLRVDPFEITFPKAEIISPDPD